MRLNLTLNLNNIHEVESNFDLNNIHEVEFNIALNNSRLNLTNLTIICRNWRWRWTANVVQPMKRARRLHSSKGSASLYRPNWVEDVRALLETVRSSVKHVHTFK